jgi:hypothetical protein
MQVTVSRLNRGRSRDFGDFRCQACGMEVKYVHPRWPYNHVRKIHAGKCCALALSQARWTAGWACGGFCVTSPQLWRYIYS